MEKATTITQGSLSRVVLRLALAFVLALTLIPFMSSNTTEAEAVEIGTADDMSAGAGLTGTQVYFGEYDYDTSTPEKEPILWHVVATDTGTATLWTTTSIGNRQYDPSAHNNWSGSDICAWLNATGSYSTGGFLNTAFAAAEQNAITNYGTTESNSYVSNYSIAQKIVLPSVAEIGDGTSTGTWGIPFTGSTDSKRGFSDYCRLRSPGPYADFAGVVLPDGNVSARGGIVDAPLAVRPAFKLNLSSVLFTSSATGGSGKNSVAIGGGFAKTDTPQGAVKLTVKDSDTTNVSLASASIDKTTVKAGDTLSVTFAGAQTSADKYVSALLVDSTGAITHYAKLSQDASGTAQLTVPPAADLPSGTYTLRVFNEQVGTDTATDYASTPIDIALTVDNVLPTVSGLSPSGSAEDIDGTIQITFSEAMSTVAGTVSLDNGVGTLTGGGWTSATVYEVSYTGLGYATEYTVTVAGFKDVIGNEMVADTTHTFTTVSAPAPTIADASKNTFTVAGGLTQTTNTDFTITATGDLQDAAGKTAGDTRFIPATASANPTVSFSNTVPYTATMKIAKAGSYTLSVTFAEQTWNGSTWIATGVTDTKSQSLTIADSSAGGNSGAKPAGTTPKTGDMAPIGLCALLSLAACAALALWRAQGTRKLFSAKHRK